MSAAKHSSTRFCKAVRPSGIFAQPSGINAKPSGIFTKPSGVPAAITTEARQQVGCPAAGFLSASSDVLGHICQRSSFFNSTRTTHISVQGLASSPVPLPATGSQTGILTLTPQPVVASTVKRAYYWASPFFI